MAVISFKNQLHEDLYDMFIHEFFNYPIDSEEYLKHCRIQEMHFALHSLFPQDHCPEQYEVWITSMQKIETGNVGTIGTFRPKDEMPMRAGFEAIIAIKELA